MKQSFFKRNFLESFSYLRESVNYIYFVIILFFASALIGFFLPDYFTFFNDFLRELGGKVQDLSTFQLVIFIFKNNIISAFLSLITGLFFGIIPISNAIINGTVLGYVVSRSFDITGSFFGVIWRLVPHGIFELPAVFISLGLGVKLGFGFISNYFKIYKKHKFMPGFGFLVLILAFVGVLITSFLSTSTSLQDLDNVTLILLSFVRIVAVVPMILLFFVFNKKLRAVNKKTFVLRIYNSLKVFFLIVLPLLIVAAII